MICSFLKNFWCRKKYVSNQIILHYKKRNAYLISNELMFSHQQKIKYQMQMVVKFVKTTKWALHKENRHVAPTIFGVWCFRVVVVALSGICHLLISVDMCGFSLLLLLLLPSLVFTAHRWFSRIFLLLQIHVSQEKTYPFVMMKSRIF